MGRIEIVAPGAIREADSAQRSIVAPDFELLGELGASSQALSLARCLTYVIYKSETGGRKNGTE